jgi:hypothetical protein
MFVFVDRSRTIRLPDARDVARKLVIDVWWPPTTGPHPLILFAHGFALTPADYAPLLRAIASAGYVVAAPIFPLTNTNAPGGPDEADLANQSRDVSFRKCEQRERRCEPATPCRRQKPVEPGQRLILVTCTRVIDQDHNLLETSNQK